MKISGIILAYKNDENLIRDCLKSLSWVDEIIVVDNGCTDKTIQMAKEKGAKIVESSAVSFAQRRNIGASKATGDWLFYVDVDERVTLELRKEIQSQITDHPASPAGGRSPFTAFAIPRRNILLGKQMRFGGWWPDYVLRLMKKTSLISWEGELHEQPKVKGEVGKLKEPFIHITHRSLAEMVEKTNKWSEIEARLLFESNHPQMVWWRFFSVAFREFWYRGIFKLGFLDGPVGIIEIIYQMFSRMITYAKLWEMQINHKPLTINH